MVLTELQSILIKHEGLRLKPYLDTVGKWTVGCGRNLSDNGISEEEAMTMLENDIQTTIKDINNNFDWYTRLNDARRIVIISMVFNMGISRFKGFKKTINLIEDKDYKEAAQEMLNSKWATQVGKRAVELSKMMETGKW